VVDDAGLVVDVAADNGQISGETFAELSRVHLFGQLRGPPNIDVEKRDGDFGTSAVLLQVSHTEPANLLVQCPPPKPQHPEDGRVWAAERCLAQLAPGG
jgi:hypothetical protein